jgi:hypothetical protein
MRMEQHVLVLLCKSLNGSDPASVLQGRATGSKREAEHRKQQKALHTPAACLPQPVRSSREPRAPRQHPTQSTPSPLVNSPVSRTPTTCLPQPVRSSREPRAPRQHPTQQETFSPGERLSVAYAHMHRVCHSLCVSGVTRMVHTSRCCITAKSSV